MLRDDRGRHQSLAEHRIRGKKVVRGDKELAFVNCSIRQVVGHFQDIYIYIYEFNSQRFPIT